MARALWSGSITFGLLNIPVQLVNAVRPKQLHFHLLHRKDHVQLRQKLVCPADKKEVPRTEAEKGFEFSKNEMVVVTEKEIETLMPKSTHEIELLDFVNVSSIDPIYFQKPYYLVPEKRAGKAYGLFLKAMEETKKAGIGTFVMRNKQYLAVLRPVDSLICLETMYYDDEVEPAKKIERAPKEASYSPRELKMAEQLIGALSKNFNPKKYHDEYRKAMMELIGKKARGKKIVMHTAEKHAKRPIDLMSALEASLKEAVKKKEVRHAA